LDLLTVVEDDRDIGFGKPYKHVWLIFAYKEAIGTRESINEYKEKNQNKIISGRSKVNEEFGGGKYDKTKDYEPKKKKKN
jgi:hypothetical protein